MVKIIIGSSIYQRAEILKEFLKFLSELNKDDLAYEYIFIDDNIEEESSKILKDFSYNENGVTILKDGINLPNIATTLRPKHYGWSREEDRINKYNRYMNLDPNGEFGSLEQYKSILDENPNLIKWEE